MPTVKNKYVTDTDYLGQLRRSFGNLVNRFKPKAPVIKPIQPKKPTMVQTIQQHNQEIKDLTEGKY